jgi:hypothetical protein
MINIFRPHTYQEVAREIAEGLKSGDVVLEEEGTPHELASIAMLFFGFTSPTRLIYTTAAAGGVGRAATSPKLIVDIKEEEILRIPERRRRELSTLIKEMKERGAEIEIRDSGGRIIDPDRITGMIGLGPSPASD